jgi:hypothetical protein
VLAFAVCNDNVWEVVLPEFTIVGRDESFESALDQAGEMLEDYWRMSAEEGKSFAESRRPIARRWFTSLTARAVRSSIAERVRHRASRRGRSRILRFPVGHAHC